MTDNAMLYVGCFAGVVISVLLPPLWAIVREKFRPADGQQKSLGGAVAVARETLGPYAALGIASALTSLLLVAFLGDKIATFNTAVLAGYAWDSTLQKMAK